MQQRPAMIESLRALPASAWVLFGGSFLNRFGAFVVPFLMLYLTRRGYSVVQAGFAAGFYGVGHVSAAVVGGYLADRIGRRRTIALSMFTSAAAMIALSQARHLPLICLFTAIAGLMTELYRPASSALIADLVPVQHRMAAYSVYRLAVNLGFALGPATAGFLANRSFFLLFAGDALTSVLFGLIAVFALPEGRTASHDESGWVPALRGAFSRRDFVLFLAASTSITFVIMQFSSSFALHVQSVGLSTSDYGRLLSINGILIVLFEVPITSVTQRFSHRIVMAIGFLLEGVGFALTGVSNSTIALAGVVVLWTLGEMISSPAAPAFVAGIAPENERGRYMAMWGSTWSIGITLGPSVGGWIYSHSPFALWCLCGVLGAAAATFMLVSDTGQPGTGRIEAAPEFDA